MLKKNINRKILADKIYQNIGFAKAMNQAISKSEGKYIFQLNPDSELLEDSISKMYNYIKLFIITKIIYKKFVLGSVF